MKNQQWSKLAFTVIVTAFAIWASIAQAQVRQPFPKLNFSLSAAQQGLDVSERSSNITISTIKTSKITNKDILKFLATALNTNWPAGAQLARAGGIIVILDRTGTNIVFNVSTGINVGDTNVVFFTTDSDRTVVRSELECKGGLVALTNGGPGLGFRGNSGSLRYGGSNFGKIFFHLFYELDGVTNTDLYFDGLNTIEFLSNQVIATNKTTLYDVTNEQAPVTGDGLFNLEWTVIKGRVTSSWKEHGVFPRPPLPPLTNQPPILGFPPITNRPPIRVFPPITNSLPTSIFTVTTNLAPPIMLPEP
jgi:hypothetical protein